MSVESDAAGAEPREDGERRRRRRGRRGGRRNRRDREGREAFQPSHEGAYDAEGADAEAAGAQPSHGHDTEFRPDAELRPNDEFRHDATEPRAPEPLHEQAAERVAEQAEAPPSPPHPQPETSDPEHPRRRSTVREPVPMSFGGEHGSAAPARDPAPPPPVEASPVVISPEEGDDADRPPRSGWWSRRVLGKS
jgi:ribonuclease E